MVCEYYTYQIMELEGRKFIREKKKYLQDLVEYREGKVKQDVVEQLRDMKNEILLLPNRDDIIGARILMTDGGGVNLFEVIKKIDDLTNKLVGDKLK